MLTLPGYDHLVQVGEGGLGRVYRATRVSTGGTVAIKELRDVTEASPAWHRALREVEAMLRLKGHPNVVSVEEILPGPFGPCIVMEYLSGGSLNDRIRERQLSVPEVVFVGHQVAGALLAAHSWGVIHRDVKPHNLLVSGFGHVKVADFGIAALMRDSGARTQTQSLTLAYASPEELDGALDVGPPADVFSLAATLAHLATGVKPSFRDRTMPVLPFDHDPALAHIGQLLRRSMAVDPTQRPTMADLVAVLEDAQTRLGGRRVTSLVVGTEAPTALPFALPGATNQSDITAQRPYPVASAPGFAPPPAAAPLDPAAATALRPAPVVAAVGAAPTDSGRRTGLVVLAAVVATLLLVGVAYLVAGRSSPGEGSTSAGATASTTAAATDVEPTVATSATSATTSPLAAPMAPESTAPGTTTAVAATTPATASTAPDPVAIASGELSRLLASDRATADSLVGQFVPQLSAKFVGLVYQGVTYGPVEILADHEKNRDAYGAILVDSGLYMFEINGGPMVGWYLTVVPTSFSTKAAATQWCTDHGLGPDDCFGREFKPVR
ncbi:MAG: serine/threonine-protein kinase [Ilumatobacteraceae bacterium]